MRARNGDVEIEFETFGDPSNPTVLLVNGLGSQLLAYRTGFCELLVDAGFHVVRYDNRDVGLSTYTEGVPPTPAKVVAALRAGEPSPAAYTVRDMAADGMAVLDELGIDRAHLWGVSMGGMIVQTMAIEFPERLRSFTSVMSRPGARDSGQATPEANEALMTPSPTERSAAIEHDLKARAVYASRDTDWEEMREYVAAQFDRAVHPRGVVHQMAAVLSDGDRTERLRAVDVPCVVVHGDRDTLIDISGGRATAAAVSGAELVEIEGMGHDLPAWAWPRLVEVMSALDARTN